MSYHEEAETQTPPRGSGEGGGHHGIFTLAGHHRTGAGAPRPGGDPMLVVEAGAGSRRSRVRRGIFAFFGRAEGGVRGGQKGRKGLVGRGIGLVEEWLRLGGWGFFAVRREAGMRRGPGPAAPRRGWNTPPAPPNRDDLFSEYHSRPRLFISTRGGPRCRLLPSHFRRAPFFHCFPLLLRAAARRRSVCFHRSGDGRTRAGGGSRLPAVPCITYQQTTRTHNKCPILCLLLDPVAWPAGVRRVRLLGLICPAGPT